MNEPYRDADELLRPDWEDSSTDAQYVTDADLDKFEKAAGPIYRSTAVAEQASKYLVSDLGQWVIRLVAEVRRTRSVPVVDEEA